MPCLFGNRLHKKLRSSVPGCQAAAECPSSPDIGDRMQIKRTYLFGEWSVEQNNFGNGKSRKTNSSSLTGEGEFELEYSLNLEQVSIYAATAADNLSYIVIPMSSILRAVLKETPKVSTTILTGTHSWFLCV
jgi:hypothetical protein